MASPLSARLILCLFAFGASGCRVELCPSAPAPLGELRLTARCASVYRPPALPGAVVETPPYEEMLALERRGAWAELGTAWFLHGVPRQAELAFEKNARPDDRDSDRAAAAFARGDSGAALELLDAVLKRHPDHPQALWNRGVVLSHLEPRLSLLAARSFEEVAKLGEPGWAEDARARARALRSATIDRQDACTGAHRAIHAFANDPGRPLPVEAVERFPAISHETLEAALHAAPDRERAKALLPLAEALDRVEGGTLLRRRALGEALEQEDPWWQLEGEIARASQETKHGRYGAVSALLEDVIARCHPAHLDSLCLQARRELSTAATSANHLAVAAEQARDHWREAEALGEWGQEVLALRSLSQALRFQIQLASARAVLDEYLARSPDAATCSYVNRNLAAIDLWALRFDAARKEIDEAVRCGEPIGLIGADAIAQLARVRLEPTDARILEQEVNREEKRNDNPESRKNLALLVRGRFTLLGDRRAGQKLLWDAIHSSELRLKRDEADATARNAWAESFRELALDAARRGEWPEVLSLTARRLQVDKPKRCALAALAGAERTAVVVRGADGGVAGFYDQNRTAPLGASLEGLVPPDLVARVETCERVDVLATSPLDTRSGLLPSRIAWAYRLGTRRPGPPRPGRHLVIADVDAPPSLHLARLSPWSEDDRATLLTARRATPANVLAAMADASIIDIHAHGLVDLTLSGATFVALAPDADGSYALTAELIRDKKVRLDRAPLVSLAACAAAWRPAFIQETASLPQAFIARGARAVLAATVNVPDREARAFFTRVSERIQAGEDAAVVLRGERETWMEKRLGGTWVKDVLLYQ